MQQEHKEMRWLNTGRIKRMDEEISEIREILFSKSIAKVNQMNHDLNQFESEANRSIDNVSQEI